ncbi:SGNH/GDSL hydrolase family protein [Cryobacterium tepidiphilum]|uniref:SGNH/GDSL hydrolase family protein n=1 Tax=Cryobacterium tepidiphilum TaxID=2486026 RepID=A0A3M8KTQ1_9MICO|nr:SGNH/GDSL hydrolase family protein [Cryobacterium tepidiphilum]RNE56650.1 SGNH/GDSL hydrolase family protein [Cryobacterium tepidiphilum]
MFTRYVALGDSFTEGVGDDLPDGQVRGWADLVALGLATAAGAPVDYANFAIRGKLLGPIVNEQLEPALALRPDLISICGGGNDLMRPKVELSYVIGLLERVVDRAREEGAHVLLLSGPNPSRHLPLGGLLQRRGDQMAAAGRALFSRPDITLVNNWTDAELASSGYWSPDKLHLNARGHTRVASNVLTALGVPVPGEWRADAAGQAPANEQVQGGGQYYRTYVLPWIGRRLTGRSSGDGRPPKRPVPEPVEPLGTAP